MQRQQFLQLLKENLNTAQARMKYFADNMRTDTEFEVGDQVYLKLQPYRQSSLACGGISSSALSIMDPI